MNRHLKAALYTFALVFALVGVIILVVATEPWSFLVIIMAVIIMLIAVIYAIFVEHT